jgi:condensin complex subunit 3
MWCKHRGAAGATHIELSDYCRRPHQTTRRDTGHTTIMPGRTSTRSTRTSTASTTKRASSARQSANAVEIPDDGPVTSLRTQVAQVFGDAQKTTATQRKLVVNLRKIQEACCYEPPTTGKGGKKAKGEVQEDFDEEDFNTEVGRCVVRILGIKKSEPVGDRLIRFLGLFLKFASEKGKHRPRPFE